MEECKLRQNSTTLFNIDTRKKYVLEKIENKQKVKLLEKKTIERNFFAGFRKKNNSDNKIYPTIEDNIAENYSYLFEDIDKNKYSEYTLETIYRNVDWWVLQLINPIYDGNYNLGSNETPNTNTNTINDVNLELYRDYLFKIISHEIDKNGYCILSTTTEENELLKIPKYMACIDVEYSYWTSMYIDDEMTMFEQGHDCCDYSKVKTKKRYSKFSK